MVEVNTDGLTYDPAGWWAGTAGTAYWGELAQGEFRMLLEKISENADFDQAVLEFFITNPRKDLYPYITDVYGRSSWHELIPASSGGVAVDLGAGLGAITEFLASRYQTVYSIEGCRDRCEFLSLRKTKKNLANVTVIQGGIHQLPFRDSSVDLVVCNGVLEWAGIDQTGDVPLIQLEFLKEARRVLKDDGILYVGIENRFGLPYFLGAHDHSGVRFTSLLPRTIASGVVRAFKGIGNFSVGSLSEAYRTYTYSQQGYQELLVEAGFSHQAVYHVEPSYDLPSYAYPATGDRAEQKRFYEMFGSKYIPFSVQNALSSNFFIFSSKKDLAGRVEKRPVYFGYYDRCILQDKALRRSGKDGELRDEQLVDGKTLLDVPRGRRKKISIGEIIQAYERCELLLPSSGASTHLDELIDSVLGRHLEVESLRKLKEQVGIFHLDKQHHGDFWLGNIIAERDTGTLTVIDPEPHLFGSRDLDIVDFGVDYIINRRERMGFRLDLQALYSHFGVAGRMDELTFAALARQVLRYSPRHRSHVLVFRYLNLMKMFLATGRLGEAGVA